MKSWRTASGRRALLTASLSLAGIVAIAHAAPLEAICFEQMWTGTSQSEDLGGARCASYTNCPKGISCYAGRVSLRIARTEIMSVSCIKYKGGTWDPTKNRCVGGIVEEDPPMSDDIVVEVCTDGCN